MDFSWIDILITASMIFFMIEGLVKGFVKSVLSFFFVLVSFISARLLSPIAVSFITEHSSLKENLALKIENGFLELFSGSLSSEAWINVTQLHNTPNALKLFIENFVTTANKTLGSVGESFSLNVAKLLLTIGCFILLFIILLIISKLLFRLIDRLTQLPVIHTCNKFLGLVAGCLKGLIFVTLFVTILYFFNLFFAWQSISTAINNSFLMPYFYLGFLFT